MKELREAVAGMKFSWSQIKASGHFKSLIHLERALANTKTEAANHSARLHDLVSQAMVSLLHVQPHAWVALMWQCGRRLGTNLGTPSSR